MKTIVVLFALLLCGCIEISDKHKTDSETKVLVLRGGGVVTYKTVQIDGVEYYISRTTGGNWVIGPKKEK
jgi:hypothetical protein